MKEENSGPSATGRKSTVAVKTTAPSAPVPPLFRRIDWITVALTTALILIGYLLTISPQVTLEDSGELAVASNPVLGTTDDDEYAKFLRVGLRAMQDAQQDIRGAGKRDGRFGHLGSLLMPRGTGKDLHGGTDHFPVTNDFRRGPERLCQKPLHVDSSARVPRLIDEPGRW